MVSVVTGLVGGFVATVAMTVVRMGIAPEMGPPPTADLWAQYVGDGDAADYKPQGMVLHLSYGTVAGGVFALLFTAFDLGFPISTLTGGVLWGLVYGVVLFAIGAGFWLRTVLGKNPDRRMAMVFLTGHLVYGTVLGLWTWLGIP